MGKNIGELLDNTLSVVLNEEKNIDAWDALMIKLRNRSLDDSFDSKEQQSYFKILTDLIKLNNNDTKITTDTDVGKTFFAQNKELSKKELSKKELSKKELSKKELNKMFKNVVLQEMKDTDGKLIGMNGVEAFMQTILVCCLDNNISIKDRIVFLRLLVELIKFATGKDNEDSF